MKKNLTKNARIKRLNDNYITVIGHLRYFFYFEISDERRDEQTFYEWLAMATWLKNFFEKQFKKNATLRQTIIELFEDAKTNNKSPLYLCTKDIPSIDFIKSEQIPKEWELVDITVEVFFSNITDEPKRVEEDQNL